MLKVRDEVEPEKEEESTGFYKPSEPHVSMQIKDQRM